MDRPIHSANNCPDGTSKDGIHPVHGEVHRTMPLRPRISIRHLMAMMLLIAVFLGLAIPAVEVYQAKEHHTHLGVDMGEPPTLAAWGGIQPPFWPRYLRRLTDRSWRHQPCGFKT